MKINRWLDDDGGENTVSNGRIDIVDGVVTNLTDVVDSLTQDVLLGGDAIALLDGRLDDVDGVVTNLTAVVSDVYTKAQSDILRVPTVSSWGRMLVGYMKIKKNSGGSFVDVEAPFNLRVWFDSDSLLKFTFLDSTPNNTDYIVTMGSDNMNLTHTAGDGQWFRVIEKLETSFKWEFNGASMDHRHVYTVCVYHNDMR